MTGFRGALWSVLLWQGGSVGADVLNGNDVHVKIEVTADGGVKAYDVVEEPSRTKIASLEAENTPGEFEDTVIRSRGLKESVPGSSMQKGTAAQAEELVLAHQLVKDLQEKVAQLKETLGQRDAVFDEDAARISTLEQRVAIAELGEEVCEVKCEAKCLARCPGTEGTAPEVDCEAKCEPADCPDGWTPLSSLPTSCKGTKCKKDECCEKLEELGTCKPCDCTDGWTPLSSPPTHCKGPTCERCECCEESKSGTCHPADCPDGWKCKDITTCKQGECCEKLDTCSPDPADRPVGWTPLSSPPTYCEGTTCKKRECFKKSKLDTCDPDDVVGGWKLLDALPVKCEGTTCRQDECFEQLGTCSLDPADCPDGWQPLSSLPTHCKAISCHLTECFKKKATCENFASELCKASTILVESQYCGMQGCTSNECCCDSFFGCTYGKHHVFVIDKSASMNAPMPSALAEKFDPLDNSACAPWGGKWDKLLNKGNLNDLVNYHLEEALRGLHQDDTFDIIFYGADTKRLFQMAVKATSENVDEAIEKALCLPLMWGTDSGKALEDAYTNERIDHLYFITDGRPTKNMGCDELLELVTAKAIPITTILMSRELGNGGGLWKTKCGGWTEESLMQQIADSTKGSYIKNPLG